MRERKRVERLHQVGDALRPVIALRAIVDADNAGVMVTDGAGTLLIHNASFASLAGINPLGEINTVEAMLASEPAAAEALFRLARAAERGETATEDLRHSQPGGIVRWLRVGIKRVGARHGPKRPADLRLWRALLQRHEGDPGECGQGRKGGQRGRGSLGRLSAPDHGMDQEAGHADRTL